MFARPPHSKEDAINREPAHLVTAQAWGSSGPTPTASCDEASKSCAEIADTVGGTTGRPSLSHAWSPEGSWTTWRDSSRACLVGTAVQAALW